LASLNLATLDTRESKLLTEFFGSALCPPLLSFRANRVSELIVIIDFESPPNKIKGFTRLNGYASPVSLKAEKCN